MHTPVKIKTLFISDLHIGSKHCQIEKILETLKKYEFETLILVGDICDAWSLQRKFYWRPEYNVFIQKVLRLSRKGVKIHYIEGNHEGDMLTHFIGETFGGISICREYLHEGVNKTILCHHGHRQEGAIDCPEWLQKCGAVIYDFSIDASFYLNKVLAFFGRKWSLSNFLKEHAKDAVKYINKFEQAVVREARKLGVEHVICGHIHVPLVAKFGEINYYNTGSFYGEAECSYIVETLHGEIELHYI